MKAKHCLLTHFSQRYPKLPNVSDSYPDTDSAHVPIISIAFDLMSLRVGDMWKVRHYKSPFETLFSELEGDEGDGVSVEVDQGGTLGNSGNMAPKETESKKGQSVEG
jgi:ribonuclease Z